MKRVEFKTFQEASEFSRTLSVDTRTTTTVHRSGDFWWVEDSRVDTADSDLVRESVDNTPAKKIYLFDKTGSLVSIFEGNMAVKTPSGKKSTIRAAGAANETDGSFEARLDNLKSYLSGRIIGQDAAVELICRKLRTTYSGLSRRSGPAAVFLFVGPSGVGKTELAKALADHLMGGEKHLIRLDMSEYMEQHSISKLIGSPPGYVGYSEDGRLTGKLSANPKSVLLLDEVEKAHPRVMDIFLQLFGEGRITDSKGETVEARDVIVVMTSNIGIKENSRIGFGTAERRAADIQLDSLKDFFRTELVNRIDRVVIFNRLEPDSIRHIIAPMLDEIRTNLLKLYGTKLSVSDELTEFLINEGYDPEFGARELKRTVEHFIQGGLGELIGCGGLTQGDCVSAYMVEGRIAFSLESHGPAVTDGNNCTAVISPVKSETSARFSAGMKVRHAKFGIGTIRKTEGDCEDQKVIVWFNSVGPKKLLLRFAGLERV